MSTYSRENVSCFSSSRSSSSKALPLLAVVVVTYVVIISSTSVVSAFAPHSVSNTRRIEAPSIIQPPLLPSTASSSSARSMSWSEVSDFYATYPIQSAVLTCGFKASIADGIAQFNAFQGNQEQQLELRRNLAYVLYGGIFVGIMCHVEYNEVFPLLFGTEQPHVLEKVLLDDFVSAPFLWLPPAYLIKAMVYEYSMKEGMQRYWKDITENALLLRYWSIWVPAQTVSFSVVPDHMRVAFMACISFFWFILFSSVASNGTTTTSADDDESTAAATLAVADDTSRVA